jgi:DNA repair protein RecO (recombination protein O)
MALVNSDAVVLRSYNLAEADRIVLCLTRSAGLVRAVAKGARRMKSRFGAALEPFTVIKLAFHEKENRELVTISTAEILTSHFDLAGQAEAAEALAYMGELVGEFAPPHEANEKLFRMVVACIDALAATPEAPRLIVRYFEIWLLRLSGLFPDVRTCGECGTTFGDTDTAYLDSEGGPRCRNCSRGAGTRLRPESRRHLTETQRMAPPQFAASFGDLKGKAGDSDVELAEFTHRLIVRALERRPRTMAASSRGPHFASHP